jgi:hypothetical protein
MNKTLRFKKLRKFIRDPNLFFYDMFRKRIIKQTGEFVRSRTQAAIVTDYMDIAEIEKVGLQSYLKSVMGAVYGAEDGGDKNSLLIWSGYLNRLITFIAAYKKAMSMDVTFYTLNGGYSAVSKVDEVLGVINVCADLNSRADFVMELSNQLGSLYVLHIYMYDIDSDGFANVRSNRAWIRKFNAKNLDTIYHGASTEKRQSCPIDAVYTWVNHADTDWQEQWAATFPGKSFDSDRYTSNDELRYSLRSLNKYAPWINRIFIVSNCNQPRWLSTDSKVFWVKHEEIFPNVAVLPTFNSHAIEACLHRIKGLSENFIYLNDDFILNQPCLPTDFFDEVGRSLAYFEPYGMVDSNAGRDESLDYLVASNNSKKFLKAVFPEYEARHLHRHVPYALKKSVLLSVEEIFAAQLNITRSAKVRSATDVNVTSFLYHHYAYASGLAVKADASGIIVRPSNIEQVLGKHAYKHKLLCFNDGDGSSENASYKSGAKNFFNLRLSEVAAWEK